MTYKDIINLISEIALNTPNVNTVIVHDIYELNSRQDIEFGVIALVDKQHQIDLETSTYNFDLIYIDRKYTLDENDNRLDVYNDGIITLNHIMNELDDIAEDIDISRPFNTQMLEQRFNDECYCVLMNISITTDNVSTC